MDFDGLETVSWSFQRDFTFFNFLTFRKNFMKHDIFTPFAKVKLCRLQQLSQPRMPPIPNLTKLPNLPFAARPGLKAGYALALGLALNLTAAHADVNYFYKPGELAGFSEVAVGMTPPQVAMFIKEPPDTVDSTEFLGIERKQLNWRTSAYSYEVYFVMNRVVAKRALTRGLQAGP